MPLWHGVIVLRKSRKKATGKSRKNFVIFLTVAATLRRLFI
jgi:hypothetical protein